MSISKFDYSSACIVFFYYRSTIWLLDERLYLYWIGAGVVELALTRLSCETACCIPLQAYPTRLDQDFEHGSLHA